MSWKAAKCHESARKEKGEARERKRTGSGEKREKKRKGEDEEDCPGENI